MKMKKRFLSILLSLAMVLGLLPGMSLTAYADPDGTPVSSGLPNTAGTYYLSEDITINSTWIVPGNTALDLNGHGIIMTGSGPVIAIEQGAHLTLNDSAPNAQHRYKVPTASRNGAGLAVVDDTGGDKTFTGGYITGGNNTLGNSAYQERGGGIRVRNGRLTMNAGTIIGNHTNNGGGAIGTDPNATVNIYGGSLLHNSADDIGGAIQQKANIYNCTIEGNIAPRAGAINSGDVNIDATVDGRKVRIANNYATNENGEGGGVRVIQSLSGNVEFVNNYAGTTRSDAYLTSAITVHNLNVNSNPIYVILSNTTGAITKNANYNNDEAAKAFFMSGRPGYAVIANTSAQAEIVRAHNVTLSGGTNATASGGATEQTGLTGAMTAVTYTANSGCKFPETSEYYKTTNGITVARTSDTVVTVSGTPTADASITIPDAVLAHTHSFTYSADGATITATCTATGCTNPAVSATLTINAPTLSTYGGTESETATLTGLDAFNTATNKTIAATDIKYVGRDGTTYTESTTAPTNVGKYTASITVEERTASVDYEIAQATTTITVNPTASDITYGQTLADSTLTGGTGSVAGGFAWKDSTVAPAVSDSQKTEYDVVFTPTNENYGAAECKVKLTVNKADSAVTTAPTAKTLTYNGSAQSLINAGTASSGTMKYAVTTENAPPKDDSLYTETIPTRTDAGTYYVWYRVKGDLNHYDSEPRCVTVNIANALYTVTSVENWEHTIDYPNDIIITVKRNTADNITYSMYTGASVDGNGIPAGGSSVAQGSLILTLKGSYLDTLSTGTHKVTISFKDGSADATISIVNAPPAPTAAPTHVPKTGDGANLVLWIGLILLGFLGIIAFTGVAGRKHRNR